MKTIVQIFLVSAFCVCSFFGKAQTANPGTTEITEWQYGKRGAVSLTYDDGSYNQFKYALPIMQRLKLSATFFVITGGFPGSKYQGRFVGRPVKEIIAETAVTPTNDKNFLERCSAAGYLGYKGTITYVTRAASAYDNPEQKNEAFKLMDSVYRKVRNGELPTGYQPCDEYLQETGSTWDDMRRDAAEGYEICSHSITHASMPGLDSANITYELEKSKEEIKNQLGEKYTFSTEVPYGYENERVMKIAYKIYPALRNRMPEPWLKEIDRASKQTPGNTDKDYIQWQRGATTKTSLTLMKAWVDTAFTKNNTWLVLVFHGIDNLGYEALPHTLLDEYFTYIKNNDDKLWIATFGDVTKYMREKESAKIQTRQLTGKITILATNELDAKYYTLPLTFKTYVPSAWKQAGVKQGSGNHIQNLEIKKDDKGAFVQYQATPNDGVITISGS